ncbi:unnamed protein product [Protopolystoma xenopodis]|uniref:GAF domain-containing protein n=1 Tax=Protopolystoma xenopodis TaxID=117903 RepID=A0A3S5A825_9PLAT|nr:unnamed protein product [Protopolystoma xenopodis]
MKAIEIGLPVHIATLETVAGDQVHFWDPAKAAIYRHVRDMGDLLVTPAATASHSGSGMEEAWSLEAACLVVPVAVPGGRLIGTLGVDTLQETDMPGQFEEHEIQFLQAPMVGRLMMKGPRVGEELRPILEKNRLYEYMAQHNSAIAPTFA